MFYLQLYDIGHSAKNHSNSKRENQLLPLLGLLFYSFQLAARDFQIDRIAHPTAYVIPVVVHWMELEILQRVNREGLIRWPVTPWATSPTLRSIKDISIKHALRDEHSWYQKATHICNDFWLSHYLVSLLHN